MRRGTARELREPRSDVASGAMMKTLKHHSKVVLPCAPSCSFAERQADARADDAQHAREAAGRTDYCSSLSLQALVG